MRRTLFFFVLGVLLVPCVSAAQDTPRFGIVMGYPAQVGVLWTIGDRFALRPELNWTHSTTETTTVQTIFNTTGVVTTNTLTITSEMNAIAPGTSALIYLSPRQGLAIHRVPRFAYAD